MQPIDSSLVECKRFESSERDQTYRLTRFKDCAGDKSVFVNCDFSYCVFERCYFHRAEFRNCIFVGARFVDCNFREGQFDRCDFRYAFFRTTWIEAHQFSANLPNEPNIRRALVRILRVNCAAMGEVESVRDLVREEIAAEREHLRQARAGKGTYYATHYSGFRRQIRIYKDSFLLFLNKWIWGHGEYPMHVAASMVLFVIAIAILLNFYAPALEGLRNSPASALTLSANIFLGLPAQAANEIPIWILYIVVIARFIFIGLFVGVIAKLVSRR